jgi:hypothetical protein
MRRLIFMRFPILAAVMLHGNWLNLETLRLGLIIGLRLVLAASVLCFHRFYSKLPRLRLLHRRYIFAAFVLCLYGLHSESSWFLLFSMVRRLMPAILGRLYARLNRFRREPSGRSGCHCQRSVGSMPWCLSKCIRAYASVWMLGGPTYQASRVSVSLCVSQK